ncbi:unnamed protein product [Adineta steineri]|uniref:Uncharacterized protein n=1 Tax=Adineta steineri TaxID=433720 RepID=A0A815NBA4_9BILA|nr:unnamed protein product [Adineta steineri]
MTSSSTWINQISELKENNELKSRTCKTYVKHPEKEICQCGRLKRSHSYTTLSHLDLNERTDIDVKWNEGTDSNSVPINVYGIRSSNGPKFVRCDNHAWILTAGVNNGVANLVGEGISQYRILKQYSKPITCIALTQWGSIAEQTRMELKQETQGYPKELKCIQQTDPNTEEDKEILEPNHTHCLILDNGELNGYLSDGPRAAFVKAATKNGTCYGVTIIVEGGLNTLEVVKADVLAKRPVVLIQKSGRMSDVLANLIQLTTSTDRTKYREPTKPEIEKNLHEYFPNLKEDKDNESTRITQIIDVMQIAHRNLLHVYQLDAEQNISEIIFQAIFSAYKDNPDEKKRARLLDLSIRWNFLDGAKQLLEINNTKREKDGRTKDKTLLGALLRQALEQNRPQFVDYFLRCGYDPRDLRSVTRPNLINAFMPKNLNKTILCQNFVINLYNHVRENAFEYHNKESVNLFDSENNGSLLNILILNQKLQQWLGSYIDIVYKPLSISSVPKPSNKLFDNQVHHDESKNDIPLRDIVVNSNDNIGIRLNDNYSQQEMLRDLFLWSVFMDLSTMTKTILVHMKERICASLIAAKIFKTYARQTPIIDVRDRLNKQVADFEIYSAKCVNVCYEINETLTCELLMREIPLFGNVTCMQIAISGENAKFLETACFDHVLNQIWYNKLALSNIALSSKFRLFGSMITLGFCAPKLLNYRLKDELYLNETREQQNKPTRMSSNGINYYMEEDQPTYWKKFRSFHETPLVKMCYHFISYIWFLLVFSYMMLYHFDSPSDTNGTLHWTEILLIITVRTMLLEEIRQIVYDLHKKMLEKWNTTTRLILTKLANPFYALPYLLFYLGIFLHYAFGNTPAVLSAARIILAFDLELWYLRSLKFVIALKFLGPKLFMLRNMLRDLAAFVYLIFIAIAAYGVVSRALIMYNQVPFTVHGIFENIFYSPYWFIHGEVNDTATLDDIIHDENSTFIAEATATHVLLAFHMLFINILLLNLLIAVFTRTIDEVQTNTEFYWRFQRYSFVREYYERPWLAYPPLIIIPHIWIVIRALWKTHCCCINGDDNTKHSSVTAPIFKMIPLNRDVLNEQWDKFENAATYSYARSVTSSEKKKDLHYQTKSSEPTTTVQTHEDMQKQLNEITNSLKRLTDALTRSDVNRENLL